MEGRYSPNHSRQKCLIVNIIITSNLPGVVALELDNFRKIVVYGVKSKLVFVAPSDGAIERVSGATGPENQLVALLLPGFQIFN